MSLRDLKKRALPNPEVRDEYHSLESEFSLIDQLLSDAHQSWLYSRTSCRTYAHAKKQH